MTDELEKIRQRLESATPGPYEARCKEFSNHAPLELWTEFGWYKELPMSYREPTTEMFANAHADIDRLLRVVERMREAIEDFKVLIDTENIVTKTEDDEREYWVSDTQIQHIAEDALADCEQILKGKK